MVVAEMCARRLANSTVLSVERGMLSPETNHSGLPEASSQPCELALVLGLVFARLPPARVDDLGDDQRSNERAAVKTTLLAQGASGTIQGGAAVRPAKAVFCGVESTLSEIRTGQFGALSLANGVDGCGEADRRFLTRQGWIRSRGTPGTLLT